MKVICQKEKLIDAINTVQRAVSTKTNYSILEGILLECQDNLKLTGNNLELSVEHIVEADILSKGSVVINSKTFGDIIRRLPDSEILLELQENNTLIIECEKSYFKLNGIDPKGYPQIPSIKKENIFEISQKTLKEMIRQTIFAVGIDENKPILTGSLLEYDNQEINLVSIDGFRIALRKTILPGSDLTFNVVIPGRTLNELSKILQVSEENLQVYKSNTQVVFEFNNCKLTSRLLSGDYINYKNILPNNFDVVFEINKNDFLSSLERAVLISTDEKKCPVIFKVFKDKMIISSNTNIGTIRDEVSIKNDTGEIEIGFNPKYFIEALKVIDDEKIKVNFTSSIGPCVIKPIENDEFQYMILPVRIREDEI